MADDNAKISLTIDASGAQAGAEQVKQAIDKTVAAERVLEAQTIKTADTVEQSEGRKKRVREAGSQSARALAQVEAAAAAVAGEGVARATERILTSLSSQTRALDNNARAWDPLGAAAERAAHKIEVLLDIAAKGGPNAERAAGQVEQAVQRAVAAAEAANGTTQRLADKARLTETFDPATASAKRMVAELAELNKAFQLGVNIAGGYSAEYQKIVDKYDEGAQAAKRAAVDNKAMLDAYARGVDRLGAAVNDAEQRVAKFHKIIAEGGPNAAQATQLLPAAQNDLAAARLNQAAGDPKLIAERKALTAEFDPLTTKTLAYQEALQRVQRAEDLGVISDKQADVERKKALGTLNGSTEALKKQEAEIKALTTEFAPLKVATEQYQATLDRLQKAQALGIIDDKQAATQRTVATRSFEQQKKAIDAHGQSTGQAAFAQRQFSVQMVQLGSSIQAGQPILLAMIQQLHQVLDVALATGTGFGVLGNAIKSAFSYVFSPIGLLVAAGAGLVALGVHSELTARRLGAMREQLAGVRDDAGQATQMAESAARHLAATTSVHFADAFKAGGTILKVPEFHGTQQQLEELIQTADKLSIRMNEDMPAGLQRLTQAMEHPSQSAQELVRHLKGFDQPLVNEIKRMEDAGRTADAFNLYLAAVNRATAGATREVTPLSEALEKLSEAFSGAWHGSHSFADEIGGGAVAALTGLVNKIKEVLDAMQHATDWLDKHSPDWLENMLGGGVKGPLRPQILPQAEKSKLDEAIGKSAQANAIDPVLLSRLQMSEGRWTDHGWETSSAGAVGALQVKPDLLAGMKRQPLEYPTAQGVTDLSDTGQNVAAGAAFFAHCLRKYHDPLLAILAFHEGEPKMDKILSGQAKPSADAVNQAAKVLEGYKGTGFAAGASAGAPGGGVPGGDASLLVKPSGLSNQDVVNQGLDVTRNMGVEPVERTKALGDIQKVREALAALSKQNKQGTAEWIELSRGLEIAQLRFQEAIEPADKLTQSLDRGTAGTTRLTDAYRKNAESVAYVTAHNRALEESRTLAAEGTAKQIQLEAELTRKYLAEADATQQLELTKQVTDINFLIEGQGRLNAAYEQSVAAGIQMTIQLKAEADARALARAGLANYADAVKLLTERNVALAQSQAVGQVKQQILANDNQITLINAEAKALTMATGEREAYLAQVRAEIALKEKGLSTNDAVAQGLIRSNQGVAAATLATQNQKKALDEITQTGEQIFGTLEKGLTEPLRDGETAAQRFGSVMVSVLGDIQKELLKLAVINPIMNALFKGEHRPEIGDLGGLGGLFGGGKDGKGGGALGALGKLFGFSGDSGGGTGAISLDQSGFADQQRAASLAHQVINATGGAGLITPATGNKWAVDSTQPIEGAPITMTPGPARLTPEQIIQKEHDEHERSLLQKGAEGDPGRAPIWGKPGSYDPIAKAGSVGDRLSGAFDEYLGNSGAPGGPANDAGTAILKTSTDKLVNSLGDQVSTIKDQVGSINSLVDTGQNQISAIGNLMTATGGCGCPGGGGGGGGGGIFGSLMNSLMGSSGGGDGMASGGDLSALTSEASANISAGAAGLHGGGLVGYDPPTFTRLVNSAMFAHAPRLHSGLGANEFAAILEKGERVLTGQQQKQVHAAANNNGGGGGHNFTFNFPADASPDGFRRAGHQVATQVQSSLARAKARNSI
jgi:hypothetical protein